MPATFDPTKARKTGWAVSLGGTDLGGVDDVKPNIKLMLSAVKFGSAGAMKLDDHVDGLTDDSHVSVIVREVTLVRLKAMCPWIGAGTAPFAGTPLPGAKLAALAAILVLHPVDKGAGTTEDLKFYKATPVQLINLPRNGQDFDKFEVIFNIYPDIDKVAAGTNPYFELLGA